MLLQSSQQSSPTASHCVITLTLLHPIQSTPVQSWTFDDGATIRIGRSTDNHVILYSAVVSRNHVELRCEGGQWMVVSLGGNGTYIDGQRVPRMPLHDGLIFRLARSGPNLQVHLGAVKGVAASIKSSPKSVNRIPMPAADDLPQTLGLPGADPVIRGVAPPVNLASSPTATGNDISWGRADAERLFSTKTGVPLKVLQTLGRYQVLKLLGQGETAVTSLAWRDGRTVVLKNLNAPMAADPEAVGQLKQLALQLQELPHPNIPRVLDGMELEGKTYLVLEMIYGQTLAQHVAQSGPMLEAAAIAWIQKLCAPLKAMHQKGMVHAHITPDHVIQRSEPQFAQSISLTDFGAVRWWHWHHSRRSNLMSYLAPEHMIEAAATPAADLYGIGTTLAFLLTGTAPKYFYQQQAGGVRFDPYSIPGIRPQMAELLSRLTQPNPAERLNSVDDLRSALSQLA